MTNNNNLPWSGTAPGHQRSLFQPGSKSCWRHLSGRQYFHPTVDGVGDEDLNDLDFDDEDVIDERNNNSSLDSGESLPAQHMSI